MKEKTSLREEKKNKPSLTSLELLYHISRELASALDLRTILQRVIQLALETTGGNSGSVIVLDDDGNPVDSTIIFTGQVINDTTQQLRVTLTKGLAGWVVANRQAVLVPDTSADARWTKRPDDAPERTGAKSAVSAPLLARDRMVGVITLVHSVPGTFTESSLDLIRAIADQAGIAVLNARLYNESQRQARVMTALAESAVALTDVLGAEDILQRILEQVSQAMQVEAVSLSLRTAQEGIFEIKAAVGPTAKQVIGLNFKTGEGIAGWVAEHGEGKIIPMAKDDPHFNPVIDHLIGFETRAIACAPIKSKGQTIGVLEALNPEGGVFGPDALLFLSGIGSMAGSVIRHAELFESLQAAHRSFQELFEDSIDPILITNLEGTVVEANRRALTATRMDLPSLLSTTIHQLHDIQVEVLDPDFGNLPPKETVSYESVLKTPLHGGTPIQVYVRRISLQDREHLQWIFRDITERKRLDTLRDDLISMIYHDIRSPLANVIYSMDVLSSVLPEDDPTYESLIDVAVRSANRIQRLTSSLLDIKRLEAGQPIVNRELTSLAEVFATAHDAIRPIAESKQMDLQIEVADDLPEIAVDKDMILRVVINLLENALKYTNMRDRITLGAKQAGEFIQVWVEDTGPGIPAEKLDTIFEKFSRLRPEGQGFGLGLAFCRMAIEGHGGEIRVESEEDKGSCFTFTLPLSSGDTL